MKLSLSVRDIALLRTVINWFVTGLWWLSTVHLNKEGFLYCNLDRDIKDWSGQTMAVHFPRGRKRLTFQRADYIECALRSCGGLKGKKKSKGRPFTGKKGLLLFNTIHQQQLFSLIILLWLSPILDYATTASQINNIRVNFIEQVLIYYFINKFQ